MGKGGKKGGKQTVGQSIKKRAEEERKKAATQLPSTYQETSYNELEKLEHNSGTGFLCIYRAFADSGVSNEAMRQMGDFVTKHGVQQDGQTAKPGKTTAWKRLAADDNRAVQILAQKYKMKGPFSGKGKALKNHNIPQGSKIIAIMKNGTAGVPPDVLNNYFKDNVTPKADRAINAPSMYSVEFHCVWGERSANAFLWHDYQQVFPQGPKDTDPVIWYHT